METKFNIGDMVQFHTTSNDMMAVNDHQCKVVGINKLPFSDTEVYSVEFTKLVVIAWPDELKPVKDKEMLS